MKLVDENDKPLPVQVGHLVDRTDAIVDYSSPHRKLCVSTIESTVFITPKSARAIALELLRGANECDGLGNPELKLLRPSPCQCCGRADLAACVIPVFELSFTDPVAYRCGTCGCELKGER